MQQLTYKALGTIKNNFSHYLKYRNKIKIQNGTSIAIFASQKIVSIRSENPDNGLMAFQYECLNFILKSKTRTNHAINLFNKITNHRKN